MSVMWPHRRHAPVGGYFPAKRSSIVTPASLAIRKAIFGLTPLAPHPTLLAVLCMTPRTRAKDF